MLPVEGLMFDEAVADADLGLYFGDHDSNQAYSRAGTGSETTHESTKHSKVSAHAAGSSSSEASVGHWPQTSLGDGRTPFRAGGREGGRTVVHDHGRMSDAYNEANDSMQAHASGSLYPTSRASSASGASQSSCSRRISNSMSSSMGSSHSVTVYDDLPDRWCAVFVHGMAGSSQDRQQLQAHLRDEKRIPVDWLFCSSQIFARWLFRKERGPHVKARCILIVAWREVKPVAEVLAAVASGLTDRLPADSKRPPLRPATDETGILSNDSQGLTRHCISDVILLASNSKRASIVIKTCQTLLTPICRLHTAYDEDQVRVIVEQLFARPFVPQAAAAASTAPDATTLIRL
eukprot:TRINITY_DN20844_c0_g1_i2.p1 TRINITY_DN20844_c0_g1~~TRINITY_DN20844_c0_g1_i2.p1  ORF type:complete len:348 (-),score=12.34 TRINITY_DN20844_c0_g1_i2:110-1153(-)